LKNLVTKCQRAKHFQAADTILVKIFQAQVKVNIIMEAGWEFFYGIANKTTRYVLLSSFIDE